MKLNLKIIVCLCFCISFSASLLLFACIHNKFVFPEKTFKSEYSCVKKLVTLVNSSFQLFKKQIKNCNCIKKDKKQLFKSNNKVRTIPSENHFIFYSPKRSYFNFTHLCPAESSLLKGTIPVSVPGK